MNGRPPGTRRPVAGDAATGRPVTGAAIARRVVFGVTMVALVAAVVLARLSCAPHPLADAPVDAGFGTGSPAAPRTPRVQRPKHADAATPSASEASAPSAPTPASPAAEAIEVVVLDAAGAPAPGADVAFTDPNGARRIGSGATTDAAGRARLAPAREQEFRVRAVRGDEIALGPVRVEAVARETLRLAGGVVVRGRVLGPGDAPIVGTTVSVRTCALDAFPAVTWATTDERGEFRTEPLARALIDGPGADPAEGGVIVRAYVAGFAGVRTHVDAAAVRSGDVTIRIASRLRRVVGRFVTDSGAPVADAVMHALGLPGWTRSDRDGRFSLDVSTTDAITLTGHAKGLVGFRVAVPAATDASERVAGRDVGSILAGQVGDETGTVPGTDVGEIVLRRGGRVAGRVVDAAGEPASSATVGLVADDGVTVGETETDDTGAFELDGVGEGTHSLEVVGFGLADPPVHGRFGPVRAGDADVSVVVTAGRAIRLRLVAGEDGRAVASERHWLVIRPSGARTGTPLGATDGAIESTTHGHSDGLVLARVGAAGTYDVAVAVPGRHSASVRGVVVRDDEIATVDVLLWRP